MPYPQLTDEQDRRRKELIERIHLAFSDERVTWDVDGIYAARTRDDWGDPRNNLARIESNRCIPWQDLTDRELCYYNNVAPWLTRAGFRAYIPAFMVFWLKYVDRKAPGSTDSIFDGCLDAITENGCASHQLSRRQIEAIVDFLSFLKELEEIDSEEYREAAAKYEAETRS